MIALEGRLRVALQSHSEETQMTTATLQLPQAFYTGPSFDKAKVHDAGR